MNNYKILSIFCLVLFLLASCRKDNISSDIDIIPPEVAINVEGTINGFVEEENGSPIVDASISVSNIMSQSNAYGFFELNGFINKQLTVIKASKAGYFNQFKNLVPSTTAKNKTRLRLIERGSPQTFSSSSEGIVTILDGSTVQFQSDAFIDE